jgi:hypothetical protein
MSATVASNGGARPAFGRKASGDGAQPVSGLSPAVCRQMAEAFPLAPDAKVIREFEPSGQPGPEARCIMGDGVQQALVIVGDHPYDLMTDGARRIASRALQKSEYSNHGLSPTGAVFALLDGRPVLDPEALEARQGDCRYGRAFLLSPSL